MTSAARVQAMIETHGWMVMAVSDLGCDNHAAHPGGPVCSGDDPYLYTVGLTQAGRPELVLRLPGRNSMEWLKAGHRILNQVAAYSRDRELAVGDVLPVGVVSWRRLTVAPGPPLSREPGGVWPGYAVQRYGRARIRLLEIVPDW